MSVRDFSRAPSSPQASVKLTPRLWGIVGMVALSGAALGVAMQVAFRPDINHLATDGPSESNSSSEPNAVLPDIAIASSETLLFTSDSNATPQSSLQLAIARPQGFQQPAQPETSVAALPAASAAATPGEAQASDPASSPADAPSVGTPASVELANTSPQPLDLTAVLSPPPPITTASADENTLPDRIAVSEPTVPTPVQASSPVTPAAVDSPPETTVIQPAAAIRTPVSSRSVPSVSVDLPAEQRSPSTATSSRNANRVQIERVEILGNTVFSDAVLESLIWQVVDPQSSLDEATTPTRSQRPLELTLTDLAQLSEAVTAYYVEQGYISSGAFIAEEGVQNGTVQIQVVEGSLEDVNITIRPSGLFSLRPAYIARRLRSATRGPLNLNRLVESVQLLENDPLIEEITTEIVPGLEAGSSILEVAVVQAEGRTVSLSSSNDNSPSIGRLGQQARISQANLLGMGDRLSLGFDRTEGSNRLHVGYSIPLTAQNGTLSFDYDTVSSRVVKAPFDRLDIESDARTYELSFRQPLVLTPTEEFALSLSAYHRDRQGAFLETLLGEAQPLPSRGADAQGRTRITALRFGQEWIKRRPKQAFALRSEFSLGLNALNATINESRPDGRFFLWRGQGQWAQSIGQDALFLVRGSLQFADGPLVPSEQLGIGGSRSVRGYRPNALLTDSGWLLSSEVRLPVLRVPEVDGLLQVAPFVDLGGGWNQGGFDSPRSGVLASTGVGLVWRMGDSFNARVDWGVPLTSESALQDSGLQFQINYYPF